MMRTIAAFLLCFTLVFPFFPHAAAAQTAQRPITLDAVIVTAPREPHKTGDVDKDLTPASHTVIPREKFDGNMESLADVIEAEVGVQVRRQGGLGSYSTVSLRGSATNQVLVFLDGILLTDSSTGVVNLANISLADVHSIEIYRGATPIQFGPATIGGVVNIVTRRAAKGMAGSVSVGAGSYGTRQGAVFFRHKPGKLDYLVSVEHMEAENNYKILNDNATEWNLDDDYWEERSNAGFSQENALFKVGYDVTSQWRLDLVDQWFSKTQDLPSWNNGPTTEASLETQRNVFSLALTGDDIASLGLNARLRFDHQLKVETYDDRQGHIGLGLQHNEYTTEVQGLSLYLEWLSQHHELSLLAEARSETFTPKDLLRPNVRSYDASRDTLTIGLQDHIILFDERLVVTPGYRWLRVEDQTSDGLDVFQKYRAGTSEGSTYGSPQIGLVYRPLDWLAFRANWAQYVRLPNFYEQFGDYGFLLSNDDLAAETGTNFDVGFSINYLRPGRPLNRLSFDFAWFRSEVDDVIVWVYDARGVGRAENISAASVVGIEVGLVAELGGFCRFSVNHTWQDAVNEGDVVSLVGNRLPGRYERSTSVRMEFFREDLRAWLELSRVEGVFYDQANLLPSRARDLANVGLSYTFHGLTATFEIKNLADRRYEDFNRYPMPGRSYFVTLSYKF